MEIQKKPGCCPNNGIGAADLLKRADLGSGE